MVSFTEIMISVVFNVIYSIQNDDALNELFQMLTCSQEWC